jgi:hypothetical protein
MSEELFKENIKYWVELDNQHKKANEDVKELRVRKNEVLEKINNHVSSNRLSDAVVKISDGRIKFSSVKVTKPLTLQYVKQCLTEKIQDSKQVEILMDYIKENRDYSYTDDIKRYYDNK